MLQIKSVATLLYRKFKLDFLGEAPGFPSYY